MKRIYILLITLASLVSFTSCEHYLTRENLDSFDDENFWSSEDNMRTFAQGAYFSYFVGYASSWSWGRYLTSGEAADEYYNTSAWATSTATSGNDWSFTNIRRHNYMLNRVELLPVEEDAKNHWRGIARFFRAKEYTNKCLLFGDFPWYDTEILPGDTELMYKDRDPLAYVATKIMEDYDFAATYVRLNDGAQQVNRWVVLAFMSRDMLYLGSLLKYHKNDEATANILFAKAKWAAERVMSGSFSIEDDLRKTFSTEDLASNKEVIFYRIYQTGIITHSLISYSTNNAQQGLTQRALDAFLAADGLPIKQSPIYNYSSDNNIRFYENMYQNRDPRLAATLSNELHINGIDGAYSYAVTGMRVWKFEPYDYDPQNEVFTGNKNTTDAPIIRLGEVLLNYAEAAAELGQFDQTAANLSINKLRDRTIKLGKASTDATAPALPKLPPMTIDGSDVKANGIVVDDPDRDPSVPSIIWEIRRERWVELMQEGFRREDIRRWKMYRFMKNQEENGVPSTGARGAIFDYMSYTPAQRASIISKVGAVSLYLFTPGDSTKVALNPLAGIANRRDWVEGDIVFERQYWNSVPLDQINFYKQKGYMLTQNPGWTQ